MSRRRAAEKRVVLTDPKFGDLASLVFDFGRCTEVNFQTVGNPIEAAVQGLVDGTYNNGYVF